MRVISHALAGHRDRIMQRKGDEGFTLIELLIVVLIIGVLAAIAIPIYLNATQGAADNTAKSNVQSAVTAVGVYVTDPTNNGNLPAALTDTDFPNAASGSPGHVTYAVNGNSFVVSAEGNTGNFFYATEDEGVQGPVASTAIPTP